MADKIINEEMNHIKHLFNYKCSDYQEKVPSNNRMNENKLELFDTMLLKPSKLMK